MKQLLALMQAQPANLPVPHVTIQNPNPATVAASAEAMMASLCRGLTLQQQKNLAMAVAPQKSALIALYLHVKISKIIGSVWSIQS